MNKDVNEVYQMDKRINRIIERISESKDISNRDKTILLKYKEQLILDGLSLSRVHKYLYELYGFSSWLKKDFEKARKDDIRRVVSWIESNPKFSDWYKYGLKICIRKFYKWLRKTKKYPKEVAWIKAYMKNHNNKLPEELLTEDDVKNLINASRDTKHKAFVAVLYENYRCDYCPKHPDPELYNLDGECKFYANDRCMTLCEFRNIGNRNLTEINLDIIYDFNQTVRHTENRLQPNGTMKVDLEVPCRNSYFVFIDSKEAWILYKEDAEINNKTGQLITSE